MKKILLIISKIVNLNSYHFYRKNIGGYWEKWYIDCIHSELWFQRSLKQIKNRERPGCSFGTPTVEYYDLDFFGTLNNIDLNKLIRIKKITKIIR